MMNYSVVSQETSKKAAQEMTGYLEREAMINYLVEPGNNNFKGETGADYFDCGKGIDEILDFSAKQGDTKAKNCEDF